MAPRTLHDKPHDIPDAAPKEAALVEFGRRVQAAMVEKGWNQAELARRATQHMKGEAVMSRDTISKYVNAQTLPGPDRLAALAKALGKRADELLPTRGVTTASDKVPAFDMRAAGDGRVWLRINQEVNYDKALKILAVLKEE